MERYTLDEVGIDTDLDGWWEIERNDNGRVTTRRLVIKHNNYPTLVGTLEVDVKPHDNGFNEWLSNKRIIRDDGHSSVNAVRQVAKALDQLRTIIQQEHRGGPPEGTREETARLHRRRVKTYIAAKRQVKEEYGYYLGIPVFCRERGNIDPSTLYRAFNFVKENGPDELRRAMEEARGNWGASEGDTTTGKGIKYRCALCGRSLQAGGKNLGTSWLCVTCAKEWEVCDVSYSEWPDWMKELVNEEQRRRRESGRADRRGERNISESFAAETQAYGEPDVDVYD